MVFLAMKSPEHRGRSLAEFEALAVPAIMTRQFRLWRNDKQPIALAVWAMASDDVTARIKAGERPLSPADWNSGPHFTLVELIAPYGGKEGFERVLGEMTGAE
ncbi:MAG: toxin-activating lysine-acyltransferase [Magnetospirillum sp.]|nr:toxin-activating lysine-acyltransferase [Magnetospirillum sp.]